MQHQAATERIRRLREYYINNSPISVNREMVSWKSHRSLLLYNEGWMKSSSAQTSKLRRSMAEAYLMENTKPVIIPGELLVGQPNLAPFTPEEEKLYDKYMLANSFIPCRQGMAEHLAMDYRLLLEKGVNGILDIINEKLAGIDISNGLTSEKYEYYLCCKIELEGFAKLCESYAQCAFSLAQNAQGSERKEYLELYEMLKRVPLNPARTFREALQSVHMYTWCLYGIYSFGKPDTYLFPYYEHDIKNGIITENQAQELIDCFYLLTIPNMSAWATESLMLGGRDYNGNLVENGLTWHFLTAIEHTHTADPNIGFCIVDETSDDILYYVSKLIADGHCQPQVWNSDEISRSMLANGYDNSAANMFTISTCSEITPIGRSGISVSPYINLLSIFLNSFKKCSSSTSFEELQRLFEQDFQSYCDDIVLTENLYQLERSRNATDPMRTSILIHDCPEKGLSHENGGARYNHIQPIILGMQNVTECFNVIRKIVFNDRIATIDELKNAIENNYCGYEDLLSYIRSRVVHFGTCEDESNELAKYTSDVVINTFKKYTTFRGAKFIPGAFSYLQHEVFGKETPASPDGRMNGMPLNDGSCPVQGYDNLGPTLSVASTLKWEPSRFLGGTSVNVKLNSGVAPEKIKAFILAYIKNHGSQLQFNVVDTETLLDAKRNPSSYGDLLVRIGGYSDYFVKLSEDLQDEIISRSQNNL